MIDHVAMQARLQPGRTAIRDLNTAREWDYAALDRAIGKCVAVLRANPDLVHGARIVSLAHNCAELIILHLACARTGLIYVPLNWRLSKAEIESLIEDADPALLIGDKALEPIESEIPRLGVAELADRMEAAVPLPYEPIDRDNISLILYTSGTSGKPKGALLSERNLDQTAFNFSILGRVTHESVFLCDSPMFHIIGLISNVRPTFLRGAMLIITEGFDAARTLSRLGDPELAVTHYFGVPQMAARLRQEDGYDPDRLRHLTAIFTGGAPHPEADIRAWVNDGISVVDGFGMSETGTTFGMSIDRDQILAKAGSVGIGTPAVEARIVNEAGGDCGTDEAGELLLRGENVTCGYWRQPEATAATFTDDGWFRTGDVARCDEDGFYYLVDRKKDMFISGGENVYPAEVEAAFAGMEGIIEAAVVGVPDERWGEVGHLAVVCKEGYTLTMDQVLEWLEPRLARYKLPKHLTVLSALPRTGSGKVQKPRLRTLLMKKED
ncbi:AMP-binding protein [Emcibacter sp.]|uniref:AMP-binding protein n=1 Tax=Emcibacter sp. TaxID=1979954 RepID=UPI002AA86CEA|nr:AMP-binding protein [Emcibacter sp.]